MTVEELVEEADDHGFTHVSRTRKLRILSDIYADVASREAWPWLEKEANVSFTGSDNSPTMPTDFSKVISLVTDDCGPLVPERLDYVTKAYHDLTATGTPHTYYFLGNELRLYPTPGAAVTARLKYVAKVSELDATDAETDILLPPRHHRVLALGMLSRLYLMDDDVELAVVFDKLYEDRISLMTDDLWMRQYDRSDRIYVVDDDDYC